MLMGLDVAGVICDEKVLTIFSCSYLDARCADIQVSLKMIFNISKSEPFAHTPEVLFSVMELSRGDASSGDCWFAEGLDQNCCADYGCY